MRNLKKGIAAILSAALCITSVPVTGMYPVMAAYGDDPVEELLSDEQKELMNQDKDDTAAIAAIEKAVAELEGTTSYIQDQSKNAFQIPFASTATFKKFGDEVVMSGSLPIPFNDVLTPVFSGTGTSFTVEVEVIPTGNSLNYNMFAGKGDNAFALRARPAGNLDFHIYAGGSWRSIEYQMPTAMANSWLNNKHQVAGIYNASNKTISLYCDGQMVVNQKATNTTSDVASSNYNLTLGACPDTGRTSQADFAAMRVYNKALTAAELATQNTDAPAYAADNAAVELWIDFDTIDIVNTNGHSYGEWVIEKEATVLADGIQHRVCAVCGHIETKKIERIEIDIDTNLNYGLAVFTVVNAQTLKPISNAQIFISTENDGENTFATDAQGQTKIVLPVGKQVVSVYAAGCLTRNLNVNIKSGVNEIHQIGLSDMPAYDAEITSQLMTIEEIEKAGIDTSDPSNQHVYKYELKLRFEPELDLSSIVAYFNADGKFIGGYSPDNEPAGEGEPEEPTYKLHYHVVNDGYWHNWCKDVEVEKNQNVALTYYPWRDSGDYIFDGWYADETFTNKIYSANIEDYTTYVYGRWIYIGEEEEEPEPVTATRGIRVPVKDEVVTVYPVNEYFYLIIRGEVTWLKEVFDVDMLVINNSLTDTLEDITATLELPEGLSLAAMVDEQQTLSQEIDYIGEGESESVHWYVRGDTAGSYSLKARLQGLIMPFEEPIDDVFVAENQLQVWAGDALHLNFEFPNAAYYDEDYPITITLTNVSDSTLYNINHMVQIEQGMVIYYDDGISKEKIEKSSWVSKGVRAFHPGDKIIIETSVNIFFESEIMQKKIEELIGMVDGIEQLLNGFKAIQTAVDATETLVNCVSGCSKALDNFDFTLSTESEAKLKLFKELQSKISSLMLSYSTSGNKTMDAAVKLANSGVKASLDAIANSPDEWLKSHSADDIKDLLSKISGLGNSISSSSSTSRKFDIFDSIRTAISAIPIKFALRDVIMTEDENNTTSIPWSYSVSQESAQYFGVSNVSKYLMALTRAAAGEKYDKSMPWYLQLIPGLDDPFAQEEAIKYIQATENEIAQFKAKDATGNVSFKAWIERNSAQEVLDEFALSRIAETGFILSCDNETASVDENGVLTFTGDGMISVIPQSQTGGILYIQDSEGNLYTYIIDVVEQHECIVGKSQVIIAPTSEYDGFAVKCCEICEEIMEIENLSFDNCCEEHIYSDWKAEEEATCTAAGIETRFCASCGITEYRFIAVKNHNCQFWEITKAATCSTEGEEVSICSICENEITRTIEKTPHTKGKWKIVKEATAFEEGLRERICESCGEVEQEVIEKLPKPSSHNPFMDISEDAWYYDAVYYNYTEGLMTGKSATIFAPDASLSRAEFVSVLYSANNEPDVTYEATFPDVPENEWYADAVIWADLAGIINGYKSGLFGPYDAVTREQMAIMMYNYAATQGYANDQRADISTFADAGSVSWYAEEAMQWAVGSGVITGKDGGTILDPQGSTSRAECAVIMQRFMETQGA